MAIAPYALTKEDIKAIKTKLRVNWVSAHARFVKGDFRHEAEEAGLRLRMDSPAGFEGDLTYEIPCQARLQTYGRERTGERTVNCHASICSPSVCECWGTIKALLRVGDELTLHFCAGAWSNQYVDKAGLHGDVCWLDVVRGTKRLRFYIDHSTCEDNSARMVRGLYPVE
jgi:hypothetical protein